MANLNQEEIQVLKMWAEGTTAKEMTKILFRSQNGIDRLAMRIRDKLDAKNATQAVYKATKMGLI